MEKGKENAIKQAKGTQHLNVMQTLLEDSNTFQGIGNVTKEMKEAILGEVSAEAEIEVQGLISEQMGINLSDDLLSGKDFTPEQKKEVENFVSWLEDVRQRPPIKVNRKSVVSFDCDLVVRFKLLSSASNLPLNKVLTAILDDWLNEKGDTIKHFVVKQQSDLLRNILDNT